jgi:hypothetical protein
VHKTGNKILVSADFQVQFISRVDSWTHDWVVASSSCRLQPARNSEPQTNCGHVTDTWDCSGWGVALDTVADARYCLPSVAASSHWIAVFWDEGQWYLLDRYQLSRRTCWLNFLAFTLINSYHDIQRHIPEDSVRNRVHQARPVAQTRNKLQPDSVTQAK